MRVRAVTRRLASILVVIANAAVVRAQALPSEPIALADGRVTVSGDVSATFGSSDPGFFNYTDYEHSALRLVRIDVAAAAKAGPHFSLLGEVRSENIDTLQAYALFARIRPWTRTRLRHPGRPDTADVRRVRAAHLRERQPAHRVSAGVPVPHVASARCVAGERRRTAPEAESGLAGAVLGGRPERGSRCPSGQRVPLGQRRAGPRRRRDLQRGRGDHRRHGFEPAFFG